MILVKLSIQLNKKNKNKQEKMQIHTSLKMN